MAEIATKPEPIATKLVPSFFYKDADYKTVAVRDEAIKNIEDVLEVVQDRIAVGLDIHPDDLVNDKLSLKIKIYRFNGKEWYFKIGVGWIGGIDSTTEYCISARIIKRLFSKYCMKRCIFFWHNI